MTLNPHCEVIARRECAICLKSQPDSKRSHNCLPSFSSPGAALTPWQRAPRTPGGASCKLWPLPASPLRLAGGRGAQSPYFNQATVENNSPVARVLQTHQHHALPGQRREGLPPPGHAPPSSTNRQCSSGAGPRPGEGPNRGRARHGGGAARTAGFPPTRAQLSPTPAVCHPPVTMTKGPGASLQAPRYPRGML